MNQHDNSLFETFWSHYPARNRRKVGKTQCKVLVDQLSDSDQELLVSAAKHYAIACRPRADEFVPAPRDPIRFLKQDWWRDWVDGDVVVCDFRMQPACESPVMDGTTTCEYHTAYRAKLAKLRQA